MIASSLLASGLFAVSQGSKCQGTYECHWCGGPCPNMWPHDDQPPVPFIRRSSIAKRPANAYICLGCWLFRRKRVSLQFLSGRLVDGQTAGGHSLFITQEGVWGIGKEDYPQLFEKFLKPPSPFIVSLVDNQTPNLLQMMVVNSFDEMMHDTNLQFTWNNIVHNYTRYELEEGIKQGPDGTEPGVQVLLKLREENMPSLLTSSSNEEPQRRGRGRPPKTSPSKEE